MQYAGLKQHSRESNQIVLESLKSALLILGKEKSFKEISITELCQKAGVSRMAFYRNFKNIDGLFSNIANDMTMEILSVAGNPFSQSSGQEWYRKVFEIIESQQEVFSIMFQENFQKEWMNNTLARITADVKPEKKIEQMMWILWGGGFTAIVSYWLNHALKESPEEMASYCSQFLPHTMEGKEWNIIQNSAEE